MREICMSKVIWIDPNIHSSENEGYKVDFVETFQDIGFDWAVDVEEGVSKINSTVKTVLITSGGMGQLLMPKIHHMENVMVVLIFTRDIPR